MRRYSIARYRRIDAAIRCNDGIKDIALKIKQKCVDMIKGFTQTLSGLPIGKKILYLLGSLAKIAGTFLTGVGAANATSTIKQAKAIYNALNEAADSGQLEDALESSGSFGFGSLGAAHRAQLFRAGIKVIGGLVMVLAGSVTTTALSAE